MEKINVAILGASGAVGREMLKILEEYDIPVAKILPLASARSAGGYVKFHGEDVLIEEATDESFAGMDYVLGAVKNGMSKRFAPAIVKSGAVYIDNSSAFRLDENVPLVVPEINGADAFENKGIIANPNCSTIITLMAVAGLAKLSPIKAMVASTYQAVSGAGQAGFSELQGQMEAIVAGKPTEHSTFPTQICLNVIPHIGDELENGYTDEEMKMQNEGRRIFHRSELKVTCTCVRVRSCARTLYPSRSRPSAALSWMRPEPPSRRTPACALSTIIRDAITRRRSTPAIRISSGSAECAATSWMRTR